MSAFETLINPSPENNLLIPVPLMEELRQRKQGYNSLPIDTAHPLYGEPVVELSDYGIAGQAYYSRPNAATGVAVDGVDPELYLRKSVAETLAKINASLANPAITEFFGSEIELWVEDALRPVALQKRLYEEVFPKLIHGQNYGISEQAMQKRRGQLIALPSYDPRRPSPHATGGAVDLSLRYKQASLGYVAGVTVELGHTDGDTSERANPDYYEQHQPQTETAQVAQRNRRALYAIMTGAALGFETALINNPTEWWHWGRGDQLSAQVEGQASAYYSFAPGLRT